jgi:hypothetical protein
MPRSSLTLHNHHLESGQLDNPDAASGYDAGYCNNDTFAWKLFLQMDSANSRRNKLAQDNVVL